MDNKEKDRQVVKGPDPKPAIVIHPAVPDTMGNGGKLVEQTKQFYKSFPK